MEENSRTNNNFDILRLTAACFVIITHSYALSNNGEQDVLSELSKGALSLSHLGLVMFFVISGYLIINSSLYSASWKSYLWKRILRLLPGLLGVLLLSAFLLGPLMTNLSINDYFNDPSTYKHLYTLSIFNISHLTLPGVFEKNTSKAVNGSLWSLQYEFTLYLVVLLLTFLGLYKKRYLILVAWIFLFSFRIFIGDKYYWYCYSSHYLLGLNIVSLYEFSFYFLSGVLVYLFKDRLYFNWKIVLVLISIYSFFAWNDEVKVLRILNYLIIPYILFYIAFLKINLNSITKYGDISYGMYIYAFPVQQIIFSFYGPLPINVYIIFSILFTLPFAIFSWFFIEKKALKYKNLIS